MHERSRLRTGCLLKVAGHFELGSESIISWFVVVHCADAITIGAKSGVAEHTTLVDSTHFYTDPQTAFYHNTRLAPVAIGDNTWVAAGAVVAHGSRIGNPCIVGSGVVVSGEVPDGHIVADARPAMRELRLPWPAPSQLPRSDEASGIPAPRQ